MHALTDKVSTWGRPNRVHAESLRRDPVAALLPDGRWVLARPVSCPTLRERLARAWDVLTGRADALYWEGQ